MVRTTSARNKVSIHVQTGDPFQDWLLLLNGDVLCVYQNTDIGHQQRSNDALKFLRSSKPVT